MIAKLIEKEFRESFKWLAIESICKARLLDMGGDIVSVTLRIERKVQNISPVDLTMVPGFAIDDWGRGRPSEIKIYSVCREGDIPTLINDRVLAKPFHIAAKSEEIIVAPNETVKTVSESVEYKHINDALVVAMMVTSIDPQVEVIAPPHIAWRVSFTNRGEVLDRPPRKVLKGALLAGQIMTLRWYPVSGVA